MTVDIFIRDGTAYFYAQPIVLSVGTKSVVIKCINEGIYVGHSLPYHPGKEHLFIPSMYNNTG